MGRFRKIEFRWIDGDININELVKKFEVIRSIDNTAEFKIEIQSEKFNLEYIEFNEQVD